SSLPRQRKRVSAYAPGMATARVSATVPAATKALLARYRAKRVSENRREMLSKVNALGKNPGGETKISVGGLKAVSAIQASGAAALDHEPGRVELGEHPDRAQQHHHEQDARQLWQRYMKETIKGIRAVDLRGIVELGRDGLQAREHREQHEGKELPHAHEDQR